jgi:hypothetical protein
MQLEAGHIANAKDQGPTELQDMINAVNSKGEIIVDFSKGLQACIRGLTPSTLEDWVSGYT